MTKDQLMRHKTQSVEHVRLEAARMRTLPLAVSGTLMAGGVAVARDAFRWEVFALMLLVSLGLQVIANFADDYGDLAHGLDDETRVGPVRGMQRGAIAPAQMKRALAGMCLATLVAGCALIWIAFGGRAGLSMGAAGTMGTCLLLGILAIAAAVSYTVGPHPYGYRGLGDVVSFLFFGVVAVAGGAYLYEHVFDPAALAAGAALGLPVAAVMNINNMRDSLADAAKGKKTIANRLYARGAAAGEPRGGERIMRGYQALLVCTSMGLSCAANLMLHGATVAGGMATALTLAAYLPLLRATHGVLKEADHTKLDRFMAPTSLGAVGVSIAFALGCVLAA